MTSDAVSEETRTLERHAQTALTVLVVALLGWVGLTTQETQVKVAQLTVEIEQIQSQLELAPLRVTDTVRRMERLEDIYIQLREKVQDLEEESDDRRP